jgi:hypothetical protein
MGGLCPSLALLILPGFVVLCSSAHSSDTRKPPPTLSYPAPDGPGGARVSANCGMVRFAEGMPDPLDLSAFLNGMPVPKAVSSRGRNLPVFSCFHFKQLWPFCGSQWDGLEPEGFRQRQIRPQCYRKLFQVREPSGDNLCVSGVTHWLQDILKRCLLFLPQSAAPKKNGTRRLPEGAAFG